MNQEIEKKKILVVDDEMLNRKVLKGFLDALGYSPELASTGQEALDVLDDSFDLVLMDIMMPVMDGYDAVKAIRENPKFEEIPVIMVTALSSIEDRLKAVECGANDFITKPIDKTELRVRTASLLKMKAARDEVKRYQGELEDMVNVRTQALQLALENLQSLQLATQEAHHETILRLSFAAEYKDEDTASHIQRMSLVCAMLAQKLGMGKDEVRLVLQASPMHDVGKIGIPDKILLKPGKLDAEEWAIMKQHPEIGQRILSNSSADLLQAGEIIAMTHHERWDGSGYPKGLAGEDIHLYGRICAVADVFDALISRRPYKEPFPMDKALAIMREGRGSHFDPKILDIFLDNIDKVQAIAAEHKDE